MAKRTGGGEIDAAELRRLLIAAVVEYGTHKLGPYVLPIPRGALAAANLAGTLATLELEGGGLLLITGAGVAFVVAAFCVRYGVLVAAMTLPAVAVTMGLAFVLYRPRKLAREREAKGLCVRCGYDMRGNVSGVCPECGVMTP